MKDKINAIADESQNHMCGENEMRFSEFSSATFNVVDVLHFF